MYKLEHSEGYGIAAFLSDDMLSSRRGTDLVYYYVTPVLDPVRSGRGRKEETIVILILSIRSPDINGISRSVMGRNEDVSCAAQSPNSAPRELPLGSTLMNALLLIAWSSSLAIVPPLSRSL